MNLPQDRRLTACSRSPDSSTKAGDLPPSSSVTGVRCLLAAALKIKTDSVLVFFSCFHLPAEELMNWKTQKVEFTEGGIYPIIFPTAVLPV